MGRHMRNIAVIIIAAFLFTFAPSPRPADACIFVPCPNQATAPTQYLGNFQTYFTDVQGFMTRLAAVQQALQYGIEFYNYMKSLEYMTFNGNFMNDISQVTSVASGLTGMYAQGESMIGQIGLQNGMSQQTANEWFQSASDTSQLAASGSMLGGAAQQLGMLGSLNGGSGFLTAANGASMITSAALLGAQSFISYASYQQQKDLALRQEALLNHEKEISKYGWATRSGFMWVPCRTLGGGMEMAFVRPQDASQCATLAIAVKGIAPPTPLQQQIAQQRYQHALQMKAANPLSPMQVPSPPPAPTGTPGSPATGTPPAVTQTP